MSGHKSWKTPLGRLLKPNEQRCTMCEEAKPFSEFSKGAHFCRPCMSKYAVKRANEDKITALIYYSGSPPKCQCCGETQIEFLCFDHINGIVGKRTLGGKGLATHLVSIGFPDGYQVLCFNCNNAKHLYGTCPHKRIGG